MANSDLLLNLVKAGTRGDQVLLRRTVEAIIAEEHAKQHHVLAQRLEEQLAVNNTTSVSRTPPTNGERISDLLHEIVPQKSFSELILSAETIAACEEVVEEQHHSELLRSYSLEPRHRLLFVGPPGNGKTSLAEAIAEALMVPLLVVRYDGIIGSYLGETALRLRTLFNYIRTNHCVLFFDEFDALGKERGDLHETGEIKRVVSSLLLQMDALPSNVVIITATNHPELLDRAVWHRFQVRLYLAGPDQEQREEWFRRFEKRLEKPMGLSYQFLAAQLKDLSFAELEEFSRDVLRRSILDKSKTGIETIICERLKQWQVRYVAPKTSGDK